MPNRLTNAPLTDAVIRAALNQWPGDREDLSVLVDRIANGMARAIIERDLAPARIFAMYIA